MEPVLIVILIIAAAICEFIDSSMGMLYGTILSPVLIIAGFNPLLVVPSILLSQALGGLTASITHHKLNNADFKFKIRQPKAIFTRAKEVGYSETFRRGMSRDLRATFFIALLGVAATISSVLVAINIPKAWLNSYIGLLVFIMGSILISNLRFTYTWKKVVGVGILSAFNKGLSGGGFGPVTTAGQMIVGRNGKAAVGSTTLAEVPICLTGFLTYFLIKGISGWDLPIFLTIGSVIGAFFGPYFTSRFKDDKKMRRIMGVLVLLLGIWMLVKTWLV